MKIIDTYKDSYFGFTNYIYEFKNGLRVVHTINPHTHQFDYALTFNAGSYYEDQIGVPEGTAHFLEHILFGNPNSKFSSKEEMEHFEFGTRYQPSLYANASTGFKFLSFFGKSHRKGASRLIESLHSRILFPLDTIDKYIEKERGIILGEKQQQIQAKKDPSLQYNRFFFPDSYSAFRRPVIGTRKSINEINSKHLRDFYNATFSSKNCVVSIQSKKQLNKKQQKAIQVLDKKLGAGHSLDVLKEPINKDFKYGFHKKEDLEGVFFSLNYFSEYPKTFNLEENRLDAFTRSFLGKIGFDYLREKKNLVYKLDIFNDFELFDHVCKGYSFSCDKDKLGELLEEVHHLFTEKWRDYIKKPHYKIWFESIVSNYIFKLNFEHNEFYARNKAMDLLIDVHNKYDFKKAKEIILSFTLEDIAKHYEQNYLDRVPLFWFISPFEDDEIASIFEGSTYYKKFSS